MKVTPRSSQNKLEVREGELSVWVSAAPTDGQANEAVCKQVAKALRLAQSRVTVAKGDTSRHKTLRIEGMTRDDVLLILGTKP